MLIFINNVNNNIVLILTKVQNCWLKNKTERNSSRSRHFLIGGCLALFRHKIKQFLEFFVGDGGYHLTKEQVEYDKKRTLFMQDNKIRTVRFTNDEICEDIVLVVARIKEALFV